MAQPDVGPLLYGDLHRKNREIQPMIFDGIRLALSRPLSPNFQLSHSMTMGLVNSSYKFGVEYMGSKQVSPIESYPVFASEILSDGQLSANFIHLLTPRVKAKFIGSFAKSQCLGSQMSLDYKGDNFTTTVTAANIDLIKNSGILVGHSLHQFTKRIAAGPELVIQYATSDAKLRMITQFSLGGRFNADDYHVDATISTGGAHISYNHRAHDSLQFGAELTTDKSVGQSTASFYYQYEMKKSHTVFRGSIDSGWNVGALMEKRFAPLPVVLSMCAVMNHLKNSTTVGLGLSVG